MNKLPLVVAVPLMLLMMCSVVWMLAEVLRRSHARGTRGRYIWASVERPTRYPAIAYLAISAVLNARVYDDWLMFCFDGVGIAVQILLVAEKKRDGDDDDYWHSFSERLGSFLAGRSLSRTSA